MAWMLNTNTMLRNQTHQWGIQLSKWQFVISGKEPTLQSLAENWSAVRYQTNWTLEPVHIFCDSELATIQTDNGGQVLKQSSPQADYPAVATASANTVKVIQDSEELSELQPTQLLIVSQHDPVTPDNNHPLVMCPEWESLPRT